ncbi:hypothetical protein [Planctopirus hydrillae]|uniref:Uncharacterized protein n=1 Tax=Planctopirus hydrillae TaxID=1841610 RepID=A0A1C3E7Q8_9PLAN|nr:hypothetical protein [Planctopirus hydrillae]ODA29261.1 hypothetical protein A6X21_09175 [Planctopirus hydrillae]
MTTYLRVDLAGNAQKGLRELSEQAADTAQEMRPLKTATEEADGEFAKQSEIIEALRLQHESLVGAMRETVDQSQKVAAEQSAQRAAYEQTGSVVNNLITTGGGLVLTYWKMQSASKALNAVMGFFGKNSGTARVALAGLGTAAKAAAPRLLLLAGGAAATGGALFALYGAYQAGVSVMKLFDAGLKQGAKATEEQRKKFADLQSEARRTGETVEEAAARMGVSLKELDVHSANLITTLGKGSFDVANKFVQPFTGAFRRLTEQFQEVDGNWGKAVKTLTDGFESAFKDLAEGTGSLARDLVSPFEEGLSMAISLRDEWLQNDSVLMQVANTVRDHVTSQFKLLGTGTQEAGKWFTESRDAASANIAVYFGWAESAEKVRNELKQLREARQASNKVDDFQNASKDDFARLRGVFEAADNERAKQAEKEKVRAYETTEQIDAELAKLRQAAGEKARIDKLTAEETAKLAQQVQILETRRAEIVTEARKAEVEATRRAAEEAQKAEAARMKAIEEQIRKQEEQQQKLFDLYREENQSTSLQALQDRHRLEMRQMDAKGLNEEQKHRARVRQIEEEMRLRDEQADSEEDRVKVSAERDRALAKEATDYQIQQLDREVAATRKAEEDKLKAADEAKRQREEFLKQQGIDGNQILNQVDPRQVRKQLQDKAAAEAARKFYDENAGRVDMTDAKQFRDFERKSRQAQDKARAQAARQFARGQTDPEQLAAAQQEAAANTLQAMADNGQVTQEAVKALAELTQQASIERQNNERLSAEVAQIRKAMPALNQSARNDLKRAKAGSLL